MFFGLFFGFGDWRRVVVEEQGRLPLWLPCSLDCWGPSLLPSSGRQKQAAPGTRWTRRASQLRGYCSPCPLLASAAPLLPRSFLPLPFPSLFFLFFSFLPFFYLPSKLLGCSSSSRRDAARSLQRWRSDLFSVVSDSRAPTIIASHFFPLKELCKKNT